MELLAEYDSESESSYVNFGEGNEDRQYNYSPSFHRSQLSLGNDLLYIAENVIDADFPSTYEGKSSESVNKGVSNQIKHQNVVENGLDDSGDEASSDSSSDDDSGIYEERKGSRGIIDSGMLAEEEVDCQAVGPIKSKNEVEGEVLQPPSWALLCERENLLVLGKVLYHIANEITVVIEGAMDFGPFKEGSVVCNDEGTVLGVVQEVFGPIQKPFYIMRYSNYKQLYIERNPAVAEMQANFPIGSLLFTTREHAAMISGAELQSLRAKGSDASNAFDEEAGPEEEEFSDDEKEMAAKRAYKDKKKPTGASKLLSSHGKIGSATYSDRSRSSAGGAVHPLHTSSPAPTISHSPTIPLPGLQPGVGNHWFFSPMPPQLSVPPHSLPFTSSNESSYHMSYTVPYASSNYAYPYSTSYNQDVTDYHINYPAYSIHHRNPPPPNAPPNSQQESE